MFLLLGMGVSNIGVSKLLSKNNIQFDVVSINDEYILDSIKIEKYTCLVKSPGIMYDNILVQRFINASIPVITDIELCYRVKKIKSIAITGTNGKSTVTSMIAKCLGVLPIGNIGNSLCENIEYEGYNVIELSSFQTKGIVEYKPDIIVITNISQDHVLYHGSMEDYINDKLNILKNADSDTIVVYGDTVEEYLKEVRCKKILVEKKDHVKLGFDNINEVFSYHVLNSIGYSKQEIKDLLKDYIGNKYTFEIITDIPKVVINDSKSTNPNSLLYGINYLKNIDETSLILGGLDNDFDYSELNKYKFKYIYIYGNLADKLNYINATYRTKSSSRTELEKLIKLAIEDNSKYLLFSPGAKSFDLFKNYKERGEFFNSIINNISEEKYS